MILVNLDGSFSDTLRLRLVISSLLLLVKLLDDGARRVSSSASEDFLSRLIGFDSYFQLFEILETRQKSM